MKERCDNPKNSHFHLYGQRGISYTEDWKSFAGFYKDMGARHEGMTLDRVDVNKDYCKENCKWSDITEQNINTRARKDNKLGVKGVRKEGNKFVTIFKGIEVGRFSTLDEAVSCRLDYESGKRVFTAEQEERNLKKKIVGREYKKQKRNK